MRKCILPIVMFIMVPLAATPVSLLDGIGAMGDSLTDEYQFSNLSPGRNWVEQLVVSRSLSFGELSSTSRGEPRRAGYEYNWARSGATTSTLVSQGQHLGLAGQVQTGKVTLAYIGIGANDFGTRYPEIYTGLLSGGALTGFINSVVDNITTAIDTVSRAGQVKMVIGNIPDYGVIPLFTAIFTDPVRRQLATAATAAANARIQALAAERSIPVIDLFGIVKSVFSDERRLVVGGVNIDLATRSNDPRSFFLPDGIHPGTVAQGLLGNAFLQAIHVAYGATLNLRSDQEILSGAGISPPPGQNTYYDVSRFVIYSLSSSPLIFPQVTVGGGFSTFFVLANTGATPASGNLAVIDQAGTPLVVSLAEPDGGGAQAFSFPISIPPAGIRILAARPVRAGDPVASGWARVDISAGAMKGVGTFQLMEAGVLKSIAGVLAPEPRATATIPVDNDDTQGRFTGFAVANYTSKDVNIRLVTLHEDGTVADRIDPADLNPLASQKQIAKFLHQYLPARAKFRGSLAILAKEGGKFAAIALVVNQGLMTVIPVIPEKAPHISN